MREDICSIPVNEVFEPKDGCPFCRMRDMLEDRMATYITGAAMMEPDVRIETNRLGFCSEHFNQILARGSRLSVALILESLLAEVKGQVFPEGKAVPKKIAAAVRSREENCFICENIKDSMRHLLESTLAERAGVSGPLRRPAVHLPAPLRPGDGGCGKDAQEKFCALRGRHHPPCQGLS